MADVESRRQGVTHRDNGVQLDWCRSLPVLTSRDVTLREVQNSDAAALVTLMTMPEVVRFISPPPSTVEGFERFIANSQRQRALGEGACFAVTRRQGGPPIGLFQVRLPVSPEPDIALIGGPLATAEWGFALSSEWWGTGVFQQASTLVLEFAFDQVGVHRLEARCALNNGRGQRALAKVGATAEGILRQGLLAADGPVDQVLWAIVDRDWRQRVAAPRPTGKTMVH